MYGSSWHPLPGFAFWRARGEPILREWARVPEQLDLLLTHTPPLGHSDLFRDPRAPQLEGHWGCAELLSTAERVRPLLHVFGHVHEQNGVTSDGRTLFANVSICSHSLSADNPPRLFDLPVRTPAKSYEVKFL